MLVIKPFGYVLALLAAQAVSAATNNCTSWSDRFQTDLEGVCVCSEATCDTIYNGHLHLSGSEAGVFSTTKAGDRLAFSTVDMTTAANDAADFVIDTTTTYQSIIGFGGAFTDASAINVDLLDSGLQDILVDAYFGDDGLQYTIGRIPIGSTDFSLTIYSYNDVEGDLAMDNFSIDMDKAKKIPFIQRAMSSSSRGVKMFASSWAPPAWMTTDNTTINCAVQGYPGGEYWEALALYYSKFVSAYEAEGISIWAMTTQNEPTEQFSFKNWQSLRFNVTTERDFIKRDLGPMMKKNHPDLKIIMMDDQKDLLLDWDATLLDADSAQYVSGAGVHWYKDLDFLIDTAGNFGDLETFHTSYPDVFILATEACEGYLLDGIITGAGPTLQNPTYAWQRAQIYARDIIGDLSHYASGWTDWNLVLNTTGGPTWIDNLVDSPILIDEEGGAEFYKQPMFYAMGHFSKFLPADSVRVALTTSSSAASTLANVDSVAFLTPDDQVVLILSNRDSSTHDVTLSLSSQQLSTSVTLEALSIKTVVIGEVAGNSSSSSSSSSSSNTGSASSRTETPSTTTATPVSSTSSSSSGSSSSVTETPSTTTATPVSSTSSSSSGSVTETPSTTPASSTTGSSSSSSTSSSSAATATPSTTTATPATSSSTSAAGSSTVETPEPTTTATPATSSSTSAAGSSTEETPEPTTPDHNAC